MTAENQVVCAVCDGEKPFDEHAAGCPLHPDVRPSNLVSGLRNEYPQEGDALPMSASLLMEEAADEIERLRAIARPGDAAAFEEYAAARGVPFETGAGLIAALHLLAGQVASPIHAETARRAIAALGGGAAKAIETNDPPRELLPLLRKALAALDAGTAISPTSYIHDRLKELLAEKASCCEPAAETNSEWHDVECKARPNREPPHCPTCDCDVAPATAAAIEQPPFAADVSERRLHPITCGCVDCRARDSVPRKPVPTRAHESWCSSVNNECDCGAVSEDGKHGN